MSEAITKVSTLCSVCKGVGEFETANGGMLRCTFCPPGGRFADVEATLLAEVIRLTETLEDRDAEIEITRKAAGEAVDSLRATVARLENLLVEANDRLAVMTADLQESRVEKSSLAAEVERLSVECKTRHAHEVALENEKLRMYDEHSRLVRVYNEESNKSAAWWAAEVEKRDKEIRRLRSANNEDLV